MKINREKLIKILNTAAVGITRREIYEQTHSFVFTEKELVTFSGEILTRCKNPLPFKGAVAAEDFLPMVSRFPDEVVDVRLKGSEIQLHGKRREAGITRQKKIGLPFKDIPKPKTWTKLPTDLMGNLYQAARACGRDETKPYTLEVHVTPKLVEACDDWRMFRTIGKTRFSKSALIPATSIDAVSSLVFKSFSLTSDKKGRVDWIHLKTKTGHVVSIRCSQGKYPDLTPLLKVKTPERVKFPDNLSDIVARAEVMQNSSHEASIDITIEKGKISLKAKKDSGWFRESRAIKYSGKTMTFQVHPKFLQEVLDKSHKVTIGGNRLKIEGGDTTFVVALEIPKKKEDDAQEDSD